MTTTTNHQLTALLLFNKALANEMERMTHSIFTHCRDRDRSEDDREFFRVYEETISLIHANVLEIIGQNPPYETEITSPSGCTLMMADVSAFGEVVLTDDGLPVQPKTWHRGPESGESIRYERWAPGVGMVAHGYCDPTSRNLVQAG